MKQSLIERTSGRLTQFLEPVRVNSTKVGAMNFRRVHGRYLITNDAGYFALLTAHNFKRYLEGRIREDEPLYQELQDKGFIKGAKIDSSALTKVFREKNGFLWCKGPALHMLVVTLRCNQLCQYCHASVVGPSRFETDMSLETARRTVDFVFQTPGQHIGIEFQGGEPLLNWPIVKFVTEYARLKNKTAKRSLTIGLVTNMSLMDAEKLKYMMDHRVSICTSLDGPPEVHDQNRPFLGGGPSQKKVVQGIKNIFEVCHSGKYMRCNLPGALLTSTRFSFPYYKEIVDLYAELGLAHIFIRPMSPIGYAKRAWPQIGYTPQEFCRFYEKTLDYVLEMNRNGKPLIEKMASLLLTKILTRRDPGFMDMRSPTGAVLGCLAYNFNGDIFTSDEGRMLSHEGDDSFKVGNVYESDWEGVLTYPTTRICSSASVLDSQPLCSQCAYKPFCGICPVYHYETQNNISGLMPASGWCQTRMGIFDVIFKKLQDPANMKIFNGWLEIERRHLEALEAVGAPDAA